MMLKHRKHHAVRKRVGSLELEVCWRNDSFGKGACFSVFRHGREVLRFDLFDVGAHWHDYKEPMQPRHYFTRSGETIAAKAAAPGVDLDAMAAPPWDVRMRVALETAARHYPRVTEAAAWIREQLWRVAVAGKHG